MAKEKAWDRYKPVRRYVFNWLVPVIGALPVPAKKKAGMVKRIGGMIVEKSWSEIMDFVGVDVMQTIKAKLKSVGDDVSAIDEAVEKWKRVQSNKLAIENSDKLRGLAVKKEAERKSEEVYDSLLSRTAAGEPQYVQAAPSALKIRKFTLPFGIVDWKEAETVSHERVVVLYRHDNDTVVVHTKLTSYFRIYFDGIREGKYLAGKLVVEYLPEASKNE